MGTTNYPNGFPYGVTIRGLPLLSAYPGKVFWVSSTTGNNGNNGTFDRPFSTIDHAVGKCTASRGDIIMVKAGHVETVTAAAGLDLDVAGICIIFLGQGANKAYITFTTVVGADMDVDAASITLVNPRFVAGIDALTGPIDVNSADFTIVNGEWYDGTAIDTTDCIVGDANADRCVINGWKYFKGNEAGTAKQSQIQFGAASEVTLRDIYISGSFDEGNVEFTAAGLDVQFENLYLKNTDTDPSPAMVLHANTTGFAKNVKLRVASGTTYTSSVAKLQWSDDCEGFSTDGYAGEPIGTALTTGVEGLITSVGTQTSTVQSKADSVGLTASTNTSRISSTGIQVSTVSSLAASTGIQVSTVQSKADSVGITASTNTSKVDSLATAEASALTSIGLVISYIRSKVG